jgi:hypothetical protein
MTQCSSNEELIKTINYLIYTLLSFLILIVMYITIRIFLRVKIIYDRRRNIFKMVEDINTLIDTQKNVPRNINHFEEPEYYK